jgi:hypothetical protein
MMLAEAFVDPVGALLPMMAEGLAVLDTVAASAELGVTRGLAIPAEHKKCQIGHSSVEIEEKNCLHPPVMVKYVEKIGWDALAFAMKRTALT